jgi:hypothetical protein
MEELPHKILAFVEEQGLSEGEYLHVCAVLKDAFPLLKQQTTQLCDDISMRLIAEPFEIKFSWFCYINKSDCPRIPYSIMMKETLINKEDEECKLRRKINNMEELWRRYRDYCDSFEVEEIEIQYHNLLIKQSLLDKGKDERRELLSKMFKKLQTFLELEGYKDS